MKTTLWILGVAVVIGGGYYFYTTHSAGSNSATVSAPVAQVQAVPVNNTPVSAPTPPVAQSPVTPSTNQGLDCSKYASASEVISALGLSSQTAIKYSAATPNSCGISWRDSSKNAVIGTSPNSTGGITIVTNPHPNNPAILPAMESAACGGRASFGVGDVSCYSGASQVPNGGITFFKDNFMVNIIPISAQTITVAEMTSLAQLIAGRL